MSVRLVCEGASHVGRRREVNEDSYLVAPEAGLLAVADGMGGHAAGEIASRIATETLRETLGAGTTGLPPQDRIEALRGAIRLANNRLFESMEKHEELRGMGTTVVAALIRDDSLTIAYVGDSRAYLLRGGALRQLTADHSWVQEQVDLGLLTPSQAHRHPFRNIVTRALGSREDLLVDVFEERLLPGDVLLLCSDGLNSMVEDATIGEILARSAGDPRLACLRLVEAANRAGGEDNVTVVIARASMPQSGGGNGPLAGVS